MDDARLARECAAETLYRVCGRVAAGLAWDESEPLRRRWRGKLARLAGDGWALVRADDLERALGMLDERRARADACPCDDCKARRRLQVALDEEGVRG